jgi:eukaryotic-like serine/threonine-protein kinase
MVRQGALTYFHAEQFLLGKWRGFTLGRYKLLERVGVGRTGQVFLCEHIYMRKRLAIKVMRPTKAEDPVTLGRFYREARVASGLDHPNIAGTYDIDQDGPLHFLVMEYVDGACLSEIVKKFGPMNVLRASHYIRQAAMGLQYAHQRGMIHRDVEPGNIIIDRRGTAKLLDMGLARFYRDDQDLLTIKYDDKNVLGTADYVAPEQTRNSRAIDVRADIYGLGAAFYFALAGHPPFPDMTLTEKIIAHQTKKPRSLREIRPDVPQELARLIDKMMAKDPKDRFQTAEEVAEALEIWTQVAIDPPPATEMPQLSPAAKLEGYFGNTAPLTPLSNRDASHVRPEEPARSRSMSTPMLKLPDIDADLDNAATVPLPPGFKLPAALTPAPSLKPAAASEPAFANGNATAAPAKAGGSVVELILPPGKPPPPKTSAQWAQSLETNSVAASAEATPRPAKAAPLSTSAEEVSQTPAPKPREVPEEISRTPGPKPREVPEQISRTPAPKPQEVPLPPPVPRQPSRPSVPGFTLPKPPQLDITKTPSRPDLPKAEALKPEPPKPGIELLRPSNTPGLPFLPEAELSGDSPRKPSFANLQVPLDPPRSPILDRPVPSPVDVLKSPSREAPKPKPADPVRPNREVRRHVSPDITPKEILPEGVRRPPIYQPPNLMPFFNQPVPRPKQGPSALSWIFRWFLMTVMSISIGAALGAVVFYLFPRLAMQVSEYILHP